MRRFVTCIAIAGVLVQLFAIVSAYELATFASLDSFAAREVMPVFARARLAWLLQLGAVAAGAVSLVAHRPLRRPLVVRSVIYTGLAFIVAAVLGHPWLRVVAEIVALSVPLTAIAAAWPGRGTPRHAHRSCLYPRR